jgi:hypothetical protein
LDDLIMDAGPHTLATRHGTLVVPMTTVSRIILTLGRDGVDPSRTLALTQADARRLARGNQGIGDWALARAELRELIDRED